MKTYLQALAGTNSSSNASLNSTSSPSKTTNSTSNPTTSSDLPVVTPEKVSMTTIESVDKSDDISESGTSRISRTRISGGQLLSLPGFWKCRCEGHPGKEFLLKNRHYDPFWLDLFQQKIHHLLLQITLQLPQEIRSKNLDKHQLSNTDGYT